MFRSINPSAGGTTTTTNVVSTEYKLTPATGLAISSGVGLVLLMPVIVIGGLGVGLYYALKK